MSAHCCDYCTDDAKGHVGPFYYCDKHYIRALSDRNAQLLSIGYQRDQERQRRKERLENKNKRGVR